MTGTKWGWKDLGIFGLTLLAVVVLLPLVGITLWLLRAVLVVLALAAIAGAAVLFAVSGRFRNRVAEFVEPEVEYKGLRLATAVGLDRNHSWARVERDGTFVGVDHLAVACLGPPDRVELPAPGSRVERNQVLFTLARGDRELPLHSPVSGTVVARNDALLSEPDRIDGDPFGLGWVARIRCDEPGASRRLLLRGRKARDWYRSEIDRLVLTVGADPAAQPTLPDGGVVVDGLYRMIDGPAWERIRVSFFDAEPTVKPALTDAGRGALS